MPIKEIHEIRAELKAIETRLLYLAYHLTLSGRLAPQSLLDLDVASMLDAMHTMGVGSTNAIDKVLRDLEARHGECSLPPLWLAWAQIEGKDRLEQLREAL